MVKLMIFGIFPDSFNPTETLNHNECSLEPHFCLQGLQTTGKADECS